MNGVSFDTVGTTGRGKIQFFNYMERRPIYELTLSGEGACFRTGLSRQGGLVIETTDKPGKPHSTNLQNVSYANLVSIELQGRRYVGDEEPVVSAEDPQGYLEPLNWTDMAPQAAGMMVLIYNNAAQGSSSFGGTISEGANLRVAEAPDGRWVIDVKGPDKSTMYICPIGFQWRLRHDGG